jgi:hypothetical protein
MSLLSRLVLAGSVLGLGFVLLPVLDTKAPGSVLVGIGLFLIPGLAFWADRR